MSDIDLPVADSAYATLLDARHKPRNIAADLAGPLMNETEKPRCSISRDRNNASRCLARDLCTLQNSRHRT
jgi:hypothetical protein